MIQYPAPIVIERNLLIPVSGGATLAADLYRPAGDGPFPALVSMYPYHKDDLIGALFDVPMRYLASQGYAHLLIDFRGIGGSSGIAWDAGDPGEGRDGADVVECVARQPWCNGNVGMWGHSYGAITALKTAAQAPPHLKAIVPIQGVADPYHDFGHPGGCTNCLGADGAWGSLMLAMNLMPPTNPDPQGRWYKVWMEHLEHSKPYVLPWADHPDYDEYWQAKAVDPEAITIPTLVVGGWRDVFADAIPSIYARLAGPKKLLVGPWMHSIPEMAVNDPIEFLPIMKRWFDRWLRSEDNGITDEPPVTIFVQRTGAWRHEREWPIARTTPQTFFLRANGGLDGHADPDEGSDTYTVDPSVGTCAGLWDPGALGVGMPIDQRPDDLRSLTYTTAALEQDAEVTGAVEATIFAALTAGEDAIICAKLCDVEPSGASSLITTGLLRVSHRSGSERPGPVKLGETYALPVRFCNSCYLVRRGHRLRLSIAGADFPHVWPNRTNGQLRFFYGGNHASHLVLPLVPPASDGAAGPDPRPAAPRPRPGVMMPRWKIETDLVAGSVAVTAGGKSAVQLPPTGAILEIDRVATARVFRTRPDQTTVEGETTIRSFLPSVGELEVKTTSWFSHGRFALWGRASLDGRIMFERRWQK